MDKLTAPTASPPQEHPSRYSMRFMREDDILQVVEIDREAYPNQWPYPAYAYKRELNNHLASYVVVEEQGVSWGQGIGRSNGKGLLLPLLRLLHLRPRAAPSRRRTIPCIVGFAGVWRMLDEAHLTTIAVRTSRRRQGVGELLLIAAFDLALQFHASVVTLEVRISNTAAQSLYRKYGFKDAGVRRKYYSEDGEDALIMTTPVITSDAFQARLAELKERHRQRMASPALPSATST